MFKSIHPITRIFWVSLVIGVVVYQLNKTEYPGSDAVIEDAYSYGHSESLSDESSACVFPAVFFDMNSGHLNDEAMRALDEIGAKLERNPEMKIEIAGIQNGVEGTGLENVREQAIVGYLRRTYQIRPHRLVVADEMGELVKPKSHNDHHAHQEHHESYNHNGHHYEYHYKSSCKSMKSYSYSSCNKVKRHCNKERSSCNKRKQVKKTYRAVYITCLD